MSPATITSAVLDVVDDWSQPLLTHYDHASGERTELSAATLGNWAAKSANFFVDELGLGAGDEILVDLPEHWQTAAILLGAWWAGTRVHLSDVDHGSLQAVVTSADRIDHHGDVDEVLVASLDPFAMGVRDLPAGITDFATAVRVHGDQYRPGPAPTGPVLDDATTDEVVRDAAAAAGAGISAGARVVTTRGWHTAADVTANLLAPLIAGASLVTVAHADDTRLDALAATERATVVLR
ncbi:TIGR03089 family protein [Gordonia sp. CPCC 206044]|uniref:TIGR03089 family protein n=1 Tax=Gordonia sp. CPCC 206044 TaxID=3140793 RepID=UPI003AF3F554